MKRIRKLVLVIIFCILISQIFLFIFKTSHEVSYKIKIDKDVYDVREIYKNKKYHINIKYKKRDFIFLLDDNFHKKEKIIKDIISYKKDNLICLYLPNTNTEIVCNDSKVVGTYQVFKDSLDEFVDILDKKGYKVIEQDSKNVKRLGNIKINTNNLLDNHYIYVYQYNGFYSINSNDYEKIKLFNKETYKNDFGVLVGKYYVIYDYDQNYDCNTLYVIDMVKNKVKTIKLKFNISKNSYINGIYDDELYIFDRDSVKQYKINPRKRSVEEIANKNKKAVIYEGLKKVYYDVYDLKKKDIYFKDQSYILKDIMSNTSFDYLEEINDCYYYLSNDKMYLYDSVLDKKKLLFTVHDISNILLREDSIYYIYNDGLYRYHVGNLNKILTYEDFKFNNENRVQVYVK